MPSETKSTINERIKFLIDKLGMSIRGFSTALGVSDTNTRNYIDRGSKPNSEYLEKLLRRFNDINPTWLLMGEGEPFLAESSEVSEPHTAYQKNISGNAIGTNHGTAYQQHGSHGSSSEKWSEQSKEAFAALMRENELLKSQLADKERIIQLLEKSGK